MGFYGVDKENCQRTEVPISIRARDREKCRNPMMFKISSAADFCLPAGMITLQTSFIMV